MFDTRESKDRLSCTVSSEAQMVDRVLTEIRRFLAAWKVTEDHRLSLVVRELLLNAIVHGNGNEPDRRVRFELQHLRDRQFKITVEDEGSGFDYRSVNMELPDDPRLLRQRGYILIKSLSEQLSFNSRGNCVTATMNLSPPVGGASHHTTTREYAPIL